MPRPRAARPGSRKTKADRDRKKRVHLVCNAHLDPVWLWTWEEGLAEALSTFRVAADFCDQHADFVFVHNESLLYRWVQRHDPALFRRIRKQARRGQWRIGGGAYLQPDMNGPGGESHIRHYLLGRAFFERHFKVYPRTAYNFDPFGHPAGLPQILAGCGMERYVFCRPDLGTYDLPRGAFRWQDRSGAEVLTRRSDDHYLTNGKIARKVERFLKHYADEPVTLLLWGIGNHGGGPSRAEYAELRRIQAERSDVELVESDPDAFFDELLAHAPRLPVVRGGIQESFPGCYTSCAGMKQLHREVENALLAEEARSALRWWAGGDDPTEALADAWRDLLFAQFHDILPGSVCRAGERESLDLLHGLRDRVKRLRVAGCLAETRDEPPAAGSAVPVFLTNRTGDRWRGTTPIEFHLDNRNGATPSPRFRVRAAGRTLPCQRLDTGIAAGGDWRFRLAVAVDLAPWERLRLEVTGEPERGEPIRPARRATRADLTRRVGAMEIVISPRTGLVTHLGLRGKPSLLRAGALEPALYDDLDHSWTCGDAARVRGRKVWSQAPGWAKPVGRFRLATPAAAQAIAPTPEVRWGGAKPLPALRVVEDGPLVTIIEAVFVHEASYLIRHYVMEHRTGGFEVRDRLFLNAPDRMLKLRLPLTGEALQARGESPYGVEAHGPDRRHQDRPHQRWLAVETTAGHLGLCCTAGSAHSLTRRELTLSLTRTPPYAAFGLQAEKPAHRGRARPRQGQGEFEYTLRLRPAARHVEADWQRLGRALFAPPVHQVIFPAGSASPTPPEKAPARPAPVGPVVDKTNVLVTAVKRSEDGAALVVRLQECTGKATAYRLALGAETIRGRIGAYQLTTWRLERGRRGIVATPCDLVERPAQP